MPKDFLFKWMAAGPGFSLLRVRFRRLCHMPNTSTSTAGLLVTSIPSLRFYKLLLGLRFVTRNAQELPPVDGKRPSFVIACPDVWD